MDSHERALVTGVERLQHVERLDAADLAEKVEWAWLHSRELAEMGKQARREYELRYTPEVNYSQLMNIYRQTVTTYA